MDWNREKESAPPKKEKESKTLHYSPFTDSILSSDGFGFVWFDFMAHQPL